MRIREVRWPVLMESQQSWLIDDLISAVGTDWSCLVGSLDLLDWVAWRNIEKTETTKTERVEMVPIIQLQLHFVLASPRR